MRDKEIEIVALEFPDNVRTRHGMYLGTTENPNVGLREIIDNAKDELLGSSVGTTIDIQLKSGQKGGWYVVADNGRGIPIIMDEDKGITKTELAMTVINAGSKFTNNGNVSVGTNGTGASAFNAVCEKFVVLSKVTEQNARKSIPEVESCWNQCLPDLFYVIEFNRGIKVRETAATKKDTEEFYGFTFPDNMSTIVAFIPDNLIYQSCIAYYNPNSLSYLSLILEKLFSKSCKIVIDGNEVSNRFEPFKFEFLAEVKVPDILYGKHDKECKFYINFQCDNDMSVWDASGSVNSLVVDRGVHIGFATSAWTQALKEEYNITHNYTKSGLHLNVIAMCGEIDFSSQTKENCVKLDGLYTSEVVPYLVPEFKKIFRANKEYFDAHIERLTEYAISLIEISTINKIKQMVVIDDGSAKSRSKLPTSVRDAASRNRSKCELYICEGRSAAGTILKARNVDYQAVMALRGVPLNSVNRSLDDVLANEEMCSIISAVGCGVNEYHKIDNPRYGKIIIAADADPDGFRIASMILGFIASKMTFLIQNGMVYVLDSPLYKQDKTYIYPTDNIDEVLDRTKPYKRYKGLGEISVEEARDTITGDTRRLIQINLDNVESALQMLTLTGSRKDLMVRKNIIVDIYKTGIL